MTSWKKIEANRRNAARSTGPRTTRGKALSRFNALKHGLAQSVEVDPRTASDIDRLAQTLAEGKSQRMPAARAAASAWLDLHRVKKYRAEQLEQGLAAIQQFVADQQISNGGGDAIDLATHRLSQLDRYERRALSCCRRIFRELQTVSDLTNL